MQRGHERKNVSEDHADQAPNRAQYDGLSKELQKYIPPPSADALSQADFPCSLGDGDEHDVHDSNTAHYQRNTYNPRQRRRCDIPYLLELANVLILAIDLKVIRLTRLQSMTATKHAGNFSLRLIEVFFTRRLREE